MKRGVFLLSVAAIFSFSVQAQEEPKLVQGQLANGLRYSILPLDLQKNRVDIRMRVNAGSVDESERQMGGAHMVEHMVFRGSQAYPQGVMKMLLDKGWKRAQSYNAVTNADTTTYMFSPPHGTKDLSFSLKVLDQMLFHANINQQDLNDERKIILEEWRSGQGVGARMNVQRTASLRADSRYARWPVIGTAQSIENMPATDLKAFYDTWYHPNNMHLMIIGDVNSQKTVAEINQIFGKEASKPVPVRNYRNPELRERLQFKQLGDEKSGVSQVAYIFRFDESASKAQTEAGRKLRLTERLALSIIAHRLQNQKESWPKGIEGMALRKSDIGENTAAVGLFASVGEEAHQLGLAQIFTEIARLETYPVSDKELNAEKKALYDQLAFAEKGGKKREFEDWVNVMNTTVFMDKPYLSQMEIAKLSRPVLDSISAQDVQAMIKQWFSAKDRLVQYQAPRKKQIAPIDESVFNAVQAQALAQKPTAPIEKEALPAVDLMPLTAAQAGKIIHAQSFKAENVTQWTLENGDTVVWLKTPLTKGKSYFRAQNSGGFMAQGLSPWESQIAVQLIAQSAPENWQIEQLTQWKKDHKASLSLDQTAANLTFSGETDNANLADLLRLYYAVETEIAINDGVDETLEDMQKRLAEREKHPQDREVADALQQLRFGKLLTATQPTSADLERVNAQTLNAQWNQIRTLPTTYYFANDLSEAEMKQLVQTYLAKLPRTQALSITENQPLTGEHQTTIKANVEPRTDVYLDFYQDRQWKGEDAMLVALIRPIMANRLKAGLRDESLGIYRLRLESTLNPNSNRIESQLFFGAKPENMAALLAQTKQILADFPRSITQAEVDQAKADLARQEKQRQEDVRTLLNRLILSETHYHNPSYLSDSKKLLEGISLENVRKMAESVSSLTNSSILLVEPK